jgi:hypothetical protein
MKYIMLAAVTAFAVGTAVTAHAETRPSPDSAAQAAYSAVRSSVVSLTASFAEWDRAGFNAPSKPGQYRVYGRDGYVTSSPGYNTMVSLIRTAAYDGRNGKDHDAATEIAKARSLLAASNLKRD